MDEQRAYWFNMKTGEFEYRQAPSTDADCTQYIPQNPSAQALYKLYRVQGGLTMMEAMTNVLSACVGELAPFEPKFPE